jgi:endonuclease YncB( thermonuclease family)
MIEPQEGLCLPAEVVRVVDPDTVEVRVSWLVTVRLEDLYINEIDDRDENTRKQALEADLYLKKQLPFGTKVKLWVKPSMGELAKVFTFGRVVGRIFKSGLDISVHMVEKGFGVEKKPKKHK